ncbi:ISL3 family transposase ISMex26 [Methylobacterium mesophilicum]|uniref:ISL3 family transposase n=1 Tax=Methylobacterium mesophilicum TaxID=39956 RepID=UPI001EE1C592|nr:ISL3 family transposase [Methylobacterium mesophilicum]GJE24878.1 ISL3 family transposase ISMex26 [Methylobacterium mesophilicum]
MPRSLHPNSVIPRGLVIDHVEIGSGLTITARPVATLARCPSCDRPSSRIHSRYTRTLSDLPVAGRPVVIDVGVRRLRCVGIDCRTRIFAERLGPDLAATYARRTARLDCIVRHLGLALGGRPAACFARRLMVPASRDTMLRTVRRRAVRPVERPSVIGIDDCAFRRGQRYGTLVCDLERRRVIALLPDRESSTVETWLAAHPEITIVARDRGGGYGEATARALPHALQVADRWHLMENASAAFLDAVRKSMAAIRIAVGAATVDPERLTCAERLQYDGYLRREATGEAILALSRQGMPIKKIARTTGHSRKLVRDVLRGLTGDVFRARQSSLDAHLPRLDAEWAAGCRNGAELWRRLRANGFTGSLRVVGEWATRRRRSERAPEGAPSRVPSARILSRLTTTGRDSLTKAEAVLVATIEGEVPRLDEARALLSRFQTMIRERRRSDLDTWIEAAARSLLASFAGGLLKDKAAVAAALTQPWSNGQTEGQITRLKLVKRQMFGRAKLDLLEARLIGTP